ncbi:MAG: S-methyl-5-thioribose-1-phosphate isomerase [Methylophilaceae bacterium]
MHINKKHYRTIWPDTRCKYVEVIDQTKLPFNFSIERIYSVDMMIHAIKSMQVRGAPLIGASAAYGMALAMLEDDSDAHLMVAADRLIKSRPTAVNLSWAVNRMVDMLKTIEPERRNFSAWKEAAHIAEEDVQQNQAIGQYGLAVIKNAHKGDVSNILTHCNAGWLATVDYGTALSSLYMAHDAGLNIHVWVDETRPRNQGASLTAWELAQHGVPHTVISDNAGGHLMQQGLVDMVIVGADRVTANGDVCNKIGTYLKALAAHDNDIPFYAAVPSPTIDFAMPNGAEIKIEERCSDEVAYMQGKVADGSVQTVRVIPDESKAKNPAFDVTPARLVTGVITEKGVFAPDTLLKKLNSQ